MIVNSGSRLCAGGIASVLVLLAFSCTVAFDSELSALDYGCDSETEKRCHQECVPKDEPSTGCGVIGECNPCAFVHGRAVCGDDGACHIGDCFEPWDDCIADDDNEKSVSKGCETNIFTSPDHCGRCDLRACEGVLRPHVAEPACLAIEKIVSDSPSAAVLAANCGIGRCEVGWGDCDDKAVTGCEHDVSSDAANCGQCGHRCRTGETCEEGVCTALVTGG